MRNYVFRRLIFSIPVFLGILLFTFLLIRLQPAGPFNQVLRESARVNLQERYGLDRPLYEQFGLYLGNIAKGDLGPLLQRPSQTVNDVVAQTLPVTLQLTAMAIFLGALIGLPAGIFAAIHHNQPTDYAATFLAILGVSVPSMAIAPVLVYTFGLRLGWFPIAFWESTPPFFLGLFPKFTLEYFRHAALPVFTLGIGVSAGIARLTRASLLEELSEDYIRTARAKGLVERMVIYRHALKNALIPVVTMLGPMLVTILPASIVVEVIFAINGLGRNIVEAIRLREYFLLSSGILVFSVLIVAGNLLADVLYAWLDPRIHYEEKG